MSRGVRAGSVALGGGEAKLHVPECGIGTLHLVDLPESFFEFGKRGFECLTHLLGALIAELVGCAVFAVHEDLLFFSLSWARNERKLTFLYKYAI